MCNDERDSSCGCIQDLLEKIVRIQKQEFCRDEFTGCDKPFLGPTPAQVCYNTRPVQLFNCCSGEAWSFPINRTVRAESEVMPNNSTSSIFRVENLDDCCCTCRLLKKTGTDCYTDTDQFVTINLNCVGAVKCLNDVFVDLC